MRDGPDSGNLEGPCLVCFQKGKDIQMMTAQNVCGPLCGYKRDELARVSLWENATAPVEALRGGGLLKHAQRVKYQHIHEYDRPNVVFFGGNIHPVARGRRIQRARPLSLVLLLQLFLAASFLAVAEAVPRPVSPPRRSPRTTTTRAAGRCRCGTGTARGGASTARSRTRICPSRSR